MTSDSTMATEVKNNVPDNAEKENELKEDPPADNGQTKEEAPPVSEKVEEKAEEKKVELPGSKIIAHKTNFEKDIVYLYQFSRTPLLPSTSPYCLKVETWLRFAGIKYENVDHKAKFRSKKGQLPFVELNGEEIADSAFIIKELAGKFDKNLDASLTPEQRGIAHAMASMIENHLSWVVLWWRARYPESVIKGYQVNLQDALNTRLPNPILNFCYKLTFGRKGMKKARAHGIGVHSQEEIIELGKSDLRVLSELLCDKPFIFGNEPSVLDVVVFANLAQLHFIAADVKHPLRDAMNELFPNLVGLVTRVKERAFPDWNEICAAPQPPPSAPKAVKDKENKESKEKESKEKESKEKESKEKESKEKESKEKESKDKESKDKETKEKDAAALAEKQPLPDEPEKGKGDEKEKEQEKEPEDAKEKRDGNDN